MRAQSLLPAELLDKRLLFFVEQSPRLVLDELTFWNQHRIFKNMPPRQRYRNAFRRRILLGQRQVLIELVGFLQRIDGIAGDVGRWLREMLLGDGLDERQ